MGRDEGQRMDGHGARPPALRHRVLGTLRHRIVSGELAAGSRLLEMDLATEMGVSRGPVREAIRHLEQEGLVETFTHRGAVVLGVPDDEIDGIYELRGMIEARATVRAFRFVNEADLEFLAGLVTDMDGAYARGDIGEVAEMDLRFHGRIVELSGMALMKRIWTSLDGLVRVRTYQRLDRPGREAQTLATSGIASHADLIGVLRSKDARLARRLAFEHVVMGAPSMGADDVQDD